MTLRYPIIVTDRPTVRFIPRPGATLRVTEVGIDALKAALEDHHAIQITEYTSRRLEIEHGVKVTSTGQKGSYIMTHRQITLDASLPILPLRFYLTEIEYPS